MEIFRTKIQKAIATFPVPTGATDLLAANWISKSVAHVLRPEISMQKGKLTCNPQENEECRNVSHCGCLPCLQARKPRVS